jgi:type II secretory pathway pseudopilin PulG
MVVVVIITALAALAVPSILRQMRDRRTRQAAEEIASLYRQARLRALGRGAAVMVRYSSSTGFEMREAVLGGNDPACARLPVTSCITANWGATSPTSQQIAQFSATAGVYAGITTSVYAASNGGSGTEGTPLTGLDICFTPMGRSLFAIDGGALAPMTGVPLITVLRDAVSLKRLVVIPPNGLARTGVSL